VEPELGRMSDIKQNVLFDKAWDSGGVLLFIHLTVSQSGDCIREIPSPEIDLPEEFRSFPQLFSSCRHRDIIQIK
jgi:hypothetical protein